MTDRLYHVNRNNLKRLAVNDFFNGLTNVTVWWELSKLAITNRFRRTSIGPFWITLSILIWISMLCLVNAHLFDADILDSIPSLVAGMVVWTLIASALNEGSVSFIAAEGFLNNLNTSPVCHVLSILSQHAIVLVFNMILYPFAFIMVVYKSGLQAYFLLAIPGIILLLLNLFWMVTILAILSVRFRDVPRLISSFTQVAFFVTPVFWLPSKENIPKFVTFNPFYHMLEIVRTPLLGSPPPISSCLVTIISAIVGCGLMLMFYRATFHRIRLWL